MPKFVKKLLTYVKSFNAWRKKFYKYQIFENAKIEKSIVIFSVRKYIKKIKFFDKYQI